MAGISFSSLINRKIIEDLAIASNLHYGTAIMKRGGVEFIDKSDYKIEAWVGGLSGKSREGGGSRRRVTFILKNSQLKWRCTGNPKNHQIFCKHCVALALAVLNQ